MVEMNPARTDRGAIAAKDGIGSPTDGCRVVRTRIEHGGRPAGVLTHLKWPGCPARKRRGVVGPETTTGYSLAIIPTQAILR